MDLFQSYAEYVGRLLKTILELSPQIALLALVVFLATRLDKLEALLARTSKFKVAGLEVELGRQGAEQLKSALYEGKLRSTVLKDVTMTPEEVETVMQRAIARSELLEQRKILWIDDRPANNIHEIAAFAKVGLEVTPAPGDREAKRMLKNRDHGFCLVLSDMERYGVSDAGKRFLNSYLRPEHPDLPVIFYITKIDRDRGAPAGAFGVTNRPDELLHLVLDALERNG